MGPVLRTEVYIETLPTVRFPDLMAIDALCP